MQKNSGNRSYKKDQQLADLARLLDNSKDIDGAEWETNYLIKILSVQQCMLEKSLPYLEKCLQKDSCNMHYILNSKLLKCMSVSNKFIYDFCVKHQRPPLLDELCDALQKVCDIKKEMPGLCAYVSALPEEERTVFLGIVYLDITLMILDNHMLLVAITLFHTNMVSCIVEKDIPVLQKISFLEHLYDEIFNVLEGSNYYEYTTELAENSRYFLSAGKNCNIHVNAYHICVLQDVHLYKYQIIAAVSAIKATMPGSLVFSELTTYTEKYAKKISPSIWLEKANTFGLCMGLLVDPLKSVGIRDSIIKKALGYITQNKDYTALSKLLQPSEKEYVVQHMLNNFTDSARIRDISKIIDYDNYIVYSMILSHHKHNVGVLLSIYDDIKDSKELSILLKEYLYDCISTGTFDLFLMNTNSLYKELTIQAFWDRGYKERIHLFPFVDEKYKEEVRENFKKTYTVMEQLRFLQENFCCPVIGCVDHPFALWIVGNCIKELSVDTVPIILEIYSMDPRAYDRKKTDLIKKLIEEKNIIYLLSISTYEQILSLAHPMQREKIRYIRENYKV